MTPEQITRLKGLLERATPGPWQFTGHGASSHWIAPGEHIDGIGGGLIIAETSRGQNLGHFTETEARANATLIVEAINALPSLLAAIPVAPTVRPLSEWHEDHGDVLWYRFPIDEPPYVGSPLDLGHTVEIEFRAHETAHIKRYHVGGWPGYHTHWTPITLPTPPTGEGE